ncbi:MAG: DUF3467 domain-containing protein [Anaerolineales bacterium]|jgi:hypothetical protein
MSEKSSSPSLPPLQVPEDLETIYVNLVRIAHSPSELVFDFAHLLPGASPARVLSRMVMSPLGAKLFYRALGENLKRYESTYGEINVPGQQSLASHLFRPPQPPDEGTTKEE